MTKQVPKLGALAVVLHDGAALLVQRKNPPDAGTWGFPGGHVEFGETFAEAAVRELFEETGVTASSIKVLDTAELIHCDTQGTTTHHFVLGAVVCRYESGVPLADDDALDAAWVSLSDIAQNCLPMSDKVGDVAQAAALFLKSELARQP
jgi:ADP-ribose pyrophosphatase YjhB (NUDIX family)